MGIFLQKDLFARREGPELPAPRKEGEMRKETRRHIIVVTACDSSAAPNIAARQLRISRAIARDFADAVAA